MMTWSKAFKWAMPAWIVIVAAIGGLMFFTDYVMVVGTAEAIRWLGLVAVVALPLTAFLVKTSSDDFARFQAAFLSQNDEKN